MPEQQTGTGFWVVPGALRKTATAWDTCRADWEYFLSQLPIAKMDDLTMGLVGRKANFTRDYNNAIDTIMDTTRSGITQMADNYTDLDKVATEYEDHDKEYYERFGYIGGDDSAASDEL